MTKEIIITVSKELYEQLDEIREDGEYESVAFVCRRAVIEWHKEREIKRSGMPQVKYVNKKK